MKQLILALSWVMLAVAPASAAVSPDPQIDTVALQGYDVVSYYGEEGPKKGSGNQAAYHNGVTYLFTDKANKEAFKANPEKYLPQFGGYCAFGVTKGKKFVSDPLAYKVVDGKLYLNLNKKVQKIWEEDVPGYIKEGTGKWEGIKDKHPSEL